MKHFVKKIKKFQKVAVWLLLFANIVLAGGYTYAVNRTVFNVVAGEKAQKSLAQKNASSADLESRYVTLRNGITLDYAYAQGFQDASKSQIFVAQAPAGATLSFNAR